MVGGGRCGASAGQGGEGAVWGKCGAGLAWPGHLLNVSFGKSVWYVETRFTMRSARRGPAREGGKTRGNKRDPKATRRRETDGFRNGAVQFVVSCNLSQGHGPEATTPGHAIQVSEHKFVPISLFVCGRPCSWSCVVCGGVCATCGAAHPLGDIRRFRSCCSLFDFGNGFRDSYISAKTSPFALAGTATPYKAHLTSRSRSDRQNTASFVQIDPKNQGEPAPKFPA